MNTKHITAIFAVIMLTVLCASAYVSVPTISDGIGFQYENITIGDDRIQIGDTNITKEATFVVAAFDSLNKGAADFICSGVDDHLMIQSAIDSCIGTKASMEFQSGTYKPNATCDCIDDLLLIGQGISTRFISQSDFGAIFETDGKENIEFRNMYLDGAGINPTANVVGLIWVKNSANIKIIDVDIAGSKMNGITALQSDNVRVERCRINHTSIAPRSAIRICECEHVWVLNNELYGNMAMLGLCCPCHYTITGNHIHGYEGARGAIWFGTHYRDGYDIMIKSNTIECTTQGICFIGDGGGGYNLDDVFVEGNIINGANYGFYNGEMSFAPSTSVLTDVAMHNNVVNATTGFYFADYGTIHLDIVDNNLRECTTKLNIAAAVTGRQQRNIGWITENSGTTTLTSGTTSIAVAHGLAVTPAAGDIMVTPMEDLGSASKFRVGTYTSTTFNVTVNADPTQDVDFAWSAAVY